MADFMFNVAKGKFAKWVEDGPTTCGVMILAVTGLETDAVLKDKVSLADILSGTTDEVTNSGYARKTGVTGTVTVDQASDFTNVSIPNQSWASVLAGSNWAKLVVFIDQGGTDATRRPIVAYDFAVTPPASPINANFTGGGCARAF